VTVQKISDAITGWDYSYLTDGAGGTPPAGGIVVQDVGHLGYSFARDIRLIGFWVEFETVAPDNAVTSGPKIFHSLSAPDFTRGAIRVLTPKAVGAPVTPAALGDLKLVDTALDFAQYYKISGNYTASGLAATFTAPALLASATNPEMIGMTIDQVFIFGPYGVHHHEPSGALQAARHHPMLKYAFQANPNLDKTKPRTRIASIRFDFRLHIKLDRHFDMTENAKATQLGNQAGLFADSDSASGTIVDAIGGTIRHVDLSKGFSGGSFNGAEKPLIFEAMAPGLARGFPAYLVSPPPGGAVVGVRCWDNVHWWGARGPGNPIISAPGAFHAAHLHWRWGAAGAVTPVRSDPTFNPKVYPSGVAARPGVTGTWGPLVDPGIWMQSIRVAIVKNDPRLDPNTGVALGTLSKPDWKTLFDPGLRATPDEISAGADIVLWLSAEVAGRVTLPGYRDGSFLPTDVAAKTYIAAATGTIFLHGLFFAHNPEQTGIAVGQTGPQYTPNDEAAVRKARSWFRSSN
jgi:hypothetical protein